MEQALTEQAEKLEMLIELIPIDNNSELEAVYGSRVPVLVLDEAVICECFLDQIALNEA